MTDGGKTPISGGKGMAILLLSMLAVLALIFLTASILSPS
jgi:hypothetical protein